MTLSPGTKVGAYEIIAPLGSGGMGEVYRARETKLGRDVAIKVLPDLFAADPDRLARFQREAQLLASLNHPSTKDTKTANDTKQNDLFRAFRVFVLFVVWLCGRASCGSSRRAAGGASRRRDS